jgi:hypothetical protein
MAVLSRRAFTARAGGAALAALGAAESGFPAAVPLTPGGRHHFVGHGACPWDASGRYVLAHRVEFGDRQPSPGDPVLVGTVDLAAGRRFLPRARTTAWCWRTGAFARWLPGAPDRLLVYNVRRGDAWGAEIADVRRGAVRSVPFPVCDVDSEGRLAVSLNFSRLAWARTGYGYEGIPDAGRHVAAPEDDGVYAVDLRGGSPRLAVSLAGLARLRPKAAFADSYHWVNHLSFSPSGNRVAFLHGWALPGEAGCSRLYTADPDGGAVRLLLDHDVISHVAWRDDATLLVWARHPDQGEGFLLVSDGGGEARPFGRGALTESGHASFSPDGRWVVTDTSPDERRVRALILFRVRDGRRFDIGRFPSPPELEGPSRCDLHPRWDREGALVCIDSAHEGRRRVYAVDVSGYTS